MIFLKSNHYLSHVFLNTFRVSFGYQPLVWGLGVHSDFDNDIGPTVDLNLGPVVISLDFWWS